MHITVQDPYFDDSAYVKALVASAREFLARDYDHLLFSFHGLPERHIRKSDPTGCHCLADADCCQTPSPAHATCYRAQCFKTVAAFARAAELPAGKYSVAFQSRLGRDPWLKPYTDYELPRLASAGVRKLLVICPAFVSDCLETLDEIGNESTELFRNAGGETLHLCPCLNDHPRWIEAMRTIVLEEGRGWI